MSVKVLVLCQRKAGECSNNSTLSVENEIIPKIMKFLTDYLNGDDYSVEYMASISQSANTVGTVDYDMKVENNPEFIDFLNTHRNYYSIIILQTCPFMYMHYDLISQLLCDNGVMILSAIICDDTQLIPNVNFQLEMNNIPSLLNYFQFINGFYIKLNHPILVNPNGNQNLLPPPLRQTNLPAITNSQSQPPPKPPKPPKPLKSPTSVTSSDAINISPTPPPKPPKPTITSGGRRKTRRRKRKTRVRKRKTRTRGRITRVKRKL